MHESRRDRDLTELVVCTGACASEELCGVCPPLELRTGAEASERCQCDETGGMLNCGAGRASAPACEESDSLSQTSLVAALAPTPLPASPPSPHPPPRCYVRFDRSMFGRAGIGDITGKLATCAAFASMWGCVAAVPPPRETLSESHNDGRRVDASLWWDTYWTIDPTTLTRSAPTDGRVQRLSDQVPNGAYMRQWLLQRDGEVPVLELSFPSRDFWSDLHAEFASRTAASPTAPHARLTPAFTWELSALALRVGGDVIADLFGRYASCADDQSCPNACMHLRMGDMITEGRYPAGCTDVAAVARNAASLQRSTNSSRIFVMTDERRPAYLSSLRSALSQIYGTVRFEVDFDWEGRDLPNDNYFRMHALRAACNSFSALRANLEYHPKNLCNAGGRQLVDRTSTGRDWLPWRGRALECVQCS